MKLYSYEQIKKALADSVLSPLAFRTAVNAIDELEPTAVARDCNGCMGASFGDCEECEKFLDPDGQIIKVSTGHKMKVVDCGWR